MSTRSTQWPAGTPCWADLMTPDVAAAQDFYAAVIGWQFDEANEEYGGYVIAHQGKGPTTGIGPLMEGARPAWTMYIASDDADATAKSVQAAGGTVLMPVGDVGPLGRMGLFADPSGAVFGAWQAGTHIGAAMVNEPGGITWEDLRSNDPDTARDFYTSVFGYTYSRVGATSSDDDVMYTPGDYMMFAPGEEKPPYGGMGGMMGLPEGTPSFWLLYFSIADMSAATAAVRAGGGTVIAEPFETPFGEMAGFQDPWGATFFVAQINNESQSGQAD